MDFTDPDRKKPKHDEMQIWVYQNIKTILAKVFPSKTFNDSIRIEMEHPVTDNRFIIGFIDVYCLDLYISIEIKAEIPSLGDLVRQINFYRNYLGGPFIVVSSDDRFASVLKDQRIHFFKYKSPGELF